MDSKSNLKNSEAYPHWQFVAKSAFINTHLKGYTWKTISNHGKEKRNLDVLTLSSVEFSCALEKDLVPGEATHDA